MSLEELQKLNNELSAEISYLDTFQMTLKILMNSLYGALANKWFALFNDEIAKAITANGRYFIRDMSSYLENALQQAIPRDKKYGIYNDTDAFVFSVEPFVHKFLEKNPDASISEIVDFCQTIEDKLITPKIQEFIDKYSNELNVFDKSLIGAEREVISDKCVFLAKKKYFMRVRDNEGKRYPEDSPSMKIQGLDIIKGGTPSYSKKYLMEAVPEILDSDEIAIREYIRERKGDYLQHELHEMCQMQGVSRIDYGLNEKGVPQGSRCAITYNNYLKENDLEDTYSPINAGDRIKKVFLLEPNKFGSNVLGFVDNNFAKEIEPGIIDYDTMFEKGFLNMLKLMTGPIGWNITQETEVLDDW